MMSSSNVAQPTHWTMLSPVARYEPARPSADPDPFDDLRRRRIDEDDLAPHLGGDGEQGRLGVRGAGRRA